MKRVLVCSALLLALLPLAFAGGKKEEGATGATSAGGTTTTTAAGGTKGPIVDKVYFDVRMQQDIGLMDTAAGKTDVFFETVTGPTYQALPAADKAKLDVYAIPSTTWSLLMNPIPDKAPYTVTVQEKTFFNPLAIKEVRFAMNFLISRKQIVDEILGGAGVPMFTMATPGQPGTYRYNLIGSKFGFVAAGNEKKAIDDITRAITAASQLPENKGKLVKGKQFWEFNGEPVSIRFAIRVDDPNGRLKEGNYVTAQIEKAGIKVERLEWDRSKCNTVVYDGDPATFEWQMYTEAWGAGATRAWWDNIVAQNYAPWGCAMPGGTYPDFWNYQNAEIDDLTQRAMNGQFLNAEEYWQLTLRATELGLAEAVRIYVCCSMSYQVANKDRFNTRMAYGLGDGLSDWAVKTMDVKPDKDGKKIGRITLFSAKGSLFMTSWDPIGVDGFNDSYALWIVGQCYDPPTFEAPNSAMDTSLRAEWKDVETKLAKGKDKDGNDALVGQIAVPETAVLYDSATKTFKPVGKGVSSFSKATYTYKWGAWHTGRPITVADVMYAQAFVVDWMTKDGEDDKYYDATYESSMRPGQEVFKGIVLNSDGTITTYFDYNHPSANRIGASGAIWVKTFGNSYPISVSWVIAEALSKMVAEGGKSGTAWSFSSDPAFVEVDVLVPSCLADIKAKLQELITAKYVPASIAKWKTADEAVKDYQAAIAFIDEHKNAYISNGPFYISSVDTTANFVELTAFRDERYPYEPGYWPAAFKTQTTRIDGVNVPSTVAKDKDTLVTVKVSAVEYPAGTASAVGSGGKLKGTLVLADGTEKAYAGTFVKAGEFSVTIPAKDGAALKSGSYTFVIESALADEAPATEVATLVVP